MVGNGIEHQFLGLVLRIDVLVGIDVLTDIEVLLRQLDFWSWHVVDADADNAVGGDVDEPRTCAQTERYEMSDGLDVHHLDVVAGREVLHVSHAVNHSQWTI